MAWSVDWSVSIGGADRSEDMRPYLIDIEVADKEGTSSDTCSLTFDDSDGQLQLPPEGVAIAITLDGFPAFNGTVDKVRSMGSRGGGRLLKVTGKGFDSRGKAKEGQSFHRDDATLKEFLEEAAENAGFSLSIDPQLASIRRDYWAADSENFMALGERIAREVNGTFKLRGTKAVLVKRGGNQLPTIAGTVGPGGNVISWDIAPFTGRGKFTRAEVRWFDRDEATFKSTEVEIESDDDAPDVANIVRMPVGDEEQAKLRAEGRKSEAEREAGDGTVELDITPDAQAESPFKLSGARPGVDGTYRITDVKHKANRSGGATTSISIKQPGAGVGKDTRKSGSAPSDPDDGDLAPVPGLS